MSCSTCQSQTTVTPKIAKHVQERLVELFTAHGRRIIVIAGPTGSGKTTFSLHLAKMLDGEIISADSMQVYRGMDIGTAKATEQERMLVPHHLIDIREISEPFNVHDYFLEAIDAIDAILARGKVPIVVGGTGFYIHTLLYGPPSGPPSDPAVRDRLEKDLEALGIEALLERLQQLDPVYADSITPNDQHKIIRALEIITISGRRVSDFSWKSRPLLPTYDFRCWFLYYPRPILYERLSKRCDEMLAQGLIEEVASLDAAGIRQNSTARQAIGYRQTLDYIDNEQTEESYARYVQLFKQASHRLAKRQFTWFRKETQFRWIDLSTTSHEELADIIASDYSHNTPLAPPEPPSPPAWTE